MTEMDEKDSFPINEKEVMDYYGYSGNYGRFKMKIKFFRGWILHSLAYSSPLSNFCVKMQRLRGVTIGENSIISPRSVVTQDIPDYCIAVGNPARVVKRIDH